MSALVCAISGEPPEEPVVSLCDSYPGGWKDVCVRLRKRTSERACMRQDVGCMQTLCAGGRVFVCTDVLPTGVGVVGGRGRMSVDMYVDPCLFRR